MLDGLIGDVKHQQPIHVLVLIHMCIVDDLWVIWVSQRARFRYRSCTIDGLVHDKWLQFRGCNIIRLEISEWLRLAYPDSLLNFELWFGNQRSFVCRPKKVWSRVRRGQNLRCYLCMQVPVGPGITLSSVLWNARGFQSRWLEFICEKKMVGIFGHYNVLGGLNYWIICLPFSGPSHGRAGL